MKFKILPLFVNPVTKYRRFSLVGSYTQRCTPTDSLNKIDWEYVKPVNTPVYGIADRSKPIHFYGEYITSYSKESIDFECNRKGCQPREMFKVWILCNIAQVSLFYTFPSIVTTFTVYYLCQLKNKLSHNMQCLHWYTCRWHKMVIPWLFACTGDNPLTKVRRLSPRQVDKPCADPESFVRGGPYLITFFFSVN